jgi:hypothetical protein
VRDDFIGKREEVYLTYGSVDSSFVCVLRRVLRFTEHGDVRDGRRWNGDRMIHRYFCLHLIQRIPRPLLSSAIESMELDQCY